MATVAHEVTTASTANATSYDSAAFTPAADAYLVVYVSGAATQAVGTLTSSVAGKTFTKVTHADFDVSFNWRLYAFVSDQLASNESQTVTFDCTGDSANGTVIHVESVSGITRTGLDAVLQSAIAADQADATTPETVFSASCQTGNPTITGYGKSGDFSDVTVPTGWTELGNDNHISPGNGSQTAGRNSGFTATAITWGSVASGEYSVIALEIDASAAGGGGHIVTPAAALMMGL